ncbi:DUF309 domain-containing protein [Rhodococcus sp. PAMC28707]|uniref:DUF309 domain-containing protein n=1 Tax=unclassified Rhodococcus (in: high G+C Gram-positive bacteria) TaxID=192944 RepID=UPI00109DE9CA|nr:MULTISPECIES: DUF309 domain-containing protein [unclassified Rhodococcus (in: high G+C Gram-positive bacteria)]QCB49336.1 DUF309 domain-containing protein [Rhodococcus sp. PAMC28705]QCB58976.1 DUF309 domain-containing protein [Rhodococcus sp. PAMC28707]
MPERERDANGKPLNARPRDGLGRPLARDAIGVERIPEDLRLAPHESIAKAQRLLDADMPFHAHEILEGTWKDSPEPEQMLWQGLAQLAVGLTHLLRGNAVGARSLLEQGHDRILGYEVDPPYGLDVAGLLVWSQKLLDRLNDGELPPSPSAPRLLG